MSLVFMYRGPDGTFVNITDNVRLFTKGDSETPLLELTENSEEGSVAISTVLIDDPDVSIEIPPHRAFFARETEVASGEDRIYSGYTADRVYKPLEGVSTQGRLITLSVADINSVWARRVMIGADSKRPAETDVHRIRWLDSTAEAGLIDDDTYLSAAAPKNMDKVDYRVQMMDSVANDASQASGKNWGLTYNFVDGDGYQIWYGADELSTYDSGCLLTNDATANGSTIFEIADDTEISLDPKRIYSGVAVQWAKGTVYRQNSDTAHSYARRDVIMPSPNVKTKAKAIARALRYLDSFREEDLRIETRYWVAAAHVNAIRPFMRVQFQSSMALETAEPIECRVLRRTVKLWKPGIYEIGLTLAGGAGAPEAASCSTAIASIITAELDNQSHAGGAVSLPITPDAGADCVIFGNAMALWGPINMHASGSMTELFSFGTADIDHPTAAHMYRAVAAASGSYNVTATYSNSGHWAAVGAAIRTSATTPVQDKSAHGFAVTVTLDDPPTPGNLLVMQITERDNTAVGFVIPDGFWTEQVDASAQFEIAGDATAILTHCVVEGDVAGPFGSTADTSGVTVSEWVIS